MASCSTRRWARPTPQRRHCNTTPHALLFLCAFLALQCGGKLQRTTAGKTSTVFAHILRGLSGAKITRAKEEVFRNVLGGGCCVRCSYKADDGFLYPLDKAFFYVHKPPMCINHR